MKIYYFFTFLLLLPVLFGCKKDKSAATTPCPNWEIKQYFEWPSGGYYSYSTYSIIGNSSNLYFIFNKYSGTTITASIFNSKDYGVTFNQIANGAGYIELPTNIFALKGDTVIAYFQGAAGCSLRFSCDAGTTWKSVGCGGIPKYETPIYFHNSLHGYITVENGLIETFDGGNTWKIDSNLINFDIKDIKFIDDSTGFLITNNHCLKTINSGLKWDTIYQSSFDLKKVYFMDSKNGVIHGKKLLKTSDGGLTWNIIYSSELRSVVYKDISTIYATTLKNEVIFSTDAGSSWTTECQHILDIGEINFIGSNYFIGVNGPYDQNNNFYKKYYILKGK